VAVSAGSYQLGPGSGRVAIRTGRAGIAARAGHDLLIEVTRWSAGVEVPADDPAAATITAELDLGSLAVREGTGGARPLTAVDRTDIEKTMRKILGAATATFTSSRVIPSSGGGAVEGTLTLNGRTRPARLQVQEPVPGRYRGTATVTQTAFGITPYTGIFGALRLRDDIAVEFEVDLAKTTAG
jgi:polyisoprenoid-binding protein YceI